MLIRIHPVDPQNRLIRQVVDTLKRGGIIIYPTDSTYVIGCQLENKNALERIRHIRQLDEMHHFTLLCRNLSELATYAVVDNVAFRLLKANTPGPYTFILKATKEVPKRLLQPKRHTIGLRVPDNVVVQALLKELDQPLMSTTLSLPEQPEPFEDGQDIYDKLGKQVDLVLRFINVPR